MKLGHMKRIGVALGMMAAVTLSRGGALTPAAAQAGTPPDYAVETFGDPWDFSNPEDGGPAAGLLSGGIDSSTIADGQLKFRVNGPSFWFFLQGGYADSMATGRDASAHPVDSSRFNRMVFRLTSTSQISSSVRWFGCVDGPNCVGGKSFFVQPGTNTYDIPLGSSDAGSLNWGGKIIAMRFDFGAAAPTDIAIDWIRLTSSGGPVNEWNGPVPAIVQPDVSGGDDYATIARNGDAWDFNEPTDYLRTDNATASLANGQLNAVNAGPAKNDPSVTLRVPKAFHGDDFHRMTVKWSYEGPFALTDQPGGGMNARVVWRIAGTPPTATGKDLQESRDIIMYPSESDFTVDLASNPPSAVTDPRPDKVRIGWSGQLIELVRFDPNEDPGARVWHVDSIKLAADDAGLDSYDIELADANPAAGTLADVYADTDNQGFDGVLVARNVDLSSGKATVKWEPPAGTKGTFWIHSTIRRGGISVQRYSTGPVRMGAASGPAAYTFGPAVGGPASQIGVSDAPTGLALTTPPPAAAVSGVPPTTVKGAKPAKGAKGAKPAKPSKKKKKI
jgi:hypothetical protein